MLPRRQHIAVTNIQTLEVVYRKHPMAGELSARPSGEQTSLTAEDRFHCSIQDDTALIHRSGLCFCDFALLNPSKHSTKKFKGVGVYRAENLDTYWQEFHREEGVPIFFHFLVRCPGRGQPHSLLVWFTYRSARVPGTVTSHAKHLPALQGINVHPSGRLPSCAEMPDGSLRTGIEALEKSRQM
ncbi:hypothetical protein HELRODRAFT_181006 [Helobdella robusta]|uniref:Uncharacterized protein n=1 Tax=Helobdella robusta TaxID=6412 RepID=T1FGI6_HELRO|nr:hypothetical protein HELRODRAFT_181006 [Helobdella robusta]ESN93462.1 hypothetical protein HELRODRAFT_181006 [Helobdella robusta]